MRRDDAARASARAPPAASPFRSFTLRRDDAGVVETRGRRRAPRTPGARRSSSSPRSRSTDAELGARAGVAGSRLDGPKVGGPSRAEAGRRARSACARRRWTSARPGFARGDAARGARTAWLGFRRLEKNSRVREPPRDGGAEAPGRRGTKDREDCPRGRCDAFARCGRRLVRAAELLQDERRDLVRRRIVRSARERRLRRPRAPPAEGARLAQRAREPDAGTPARRGSRRDRLAELGDGVRRAAGVEKDVPEVMIEAGRTPASSSRARANSASAAAVVAQLPRGSAPRKYSVFASRGRRARARARTRPRRASGAPLP